MISFSKQKQNAEAFVLRWENNGDEKQETQRFWLDFLENVLNIANATQEIEFEKKVGLKNTSFIDAYLKETKVLIEQKSKEIDLNKPQKQSDGSFLTPFEQAYRYNAALPFNERARFIIICNFKEFHIYDFNLNNPLKQKPQVFNLKELPKHFDHFSFLIHKNQNIFEKEKNISIQAATLIGKLHEALLKQYGENRKDDDFVLKNLNKLCVRLVFCFYAEDSGIFPKMNQLGHYLEGFKAENAGEALEKCFKILNTPIEQRPLSLKEELKAFPYVNGGLFDNAQNDEIPPINEEIFNILVKDCSLGFDWSGISPTIFGAMFESTLNPATRRQGGMHYTSIENIHKVIDPLFLDSLKEELQKLLNAPLGKKRAKNLREFQKKLAGLNFLDPACGSGNFLTETYISLRRLENECLQAINQGNADLFWNNLEFSPVLVHLGQFFGIEINDFAASVAKTALWIAELQMLFETEMILKKDLDFLPLKNYTHIVENNALRLDWNEVIPAENLNYILGNPPFSGFNYQSKTQKEELTTIFPKVKNLDYVCCWFKKTYDLMDKNLNIQAAFVATNSICQGETVPRFWSFLPEVSIDFAHRSFVWDSEAQGKAHVHCVIVGFSKNPRSTKKIFENNKAMLVKNINYYLLDFQNILIKSRAKPICNVSPIINGTKTTDGGNLIIEADEIDDFLKKEPKAKKFIRTFLGSAEFINNKKRFCLWLKDAEPSELKQMPLVLKRIEKVRDFRLQSKKPETRQRAETPTLFEFESVSKTNYLLIPRVSSENRKYIPIGFMPPEVIASDRNHIIPNATLYHFGVLTSIVHNAWMRAVCGRLKSDYNYSNGIVYNNFIWPSANEQEQSQLSALAQNILNARAKFPNASLADLYNPLTMPAELLKAHQQNDAFVLKLYGFKPKTKENEMVAHLFQLYAQKTKEE